jgi:hypothetical protein
MLGIGWPAWFYSKSVYATCPEYAEIVDKWTALRASGEAKYGAIGWFAPAAAKEMVRQLKAWEAEGDAIKRQCKARTQQSQQSQLNFNLPTTTTDQSQASLTTQGGANPTLPILPIAIGGGALVLLVVGAVIVKKRRKAAKLAAAGVDAR